MKQTYFKFIIWGIGVFFFIYEFFLRTFVGTLSHQIIFNFHLTVETFALLGSIYFIMYGIMQIPVGILLDKFSLKKIMIFATLVCGVSTIFFAFSRGFYSALFLRLFMGVGASFAFVCVLMITYKYFPKKNFAFLAGIAQFIGTLGPIIAGGPYAMYLTMHHNNWRFSVVVIGIFGIVLAIFSFIFISNKSNTKTEIQVEESQVQFGYTKNKSIFFFLDLFKIRQAWYIALYSGLSYAPIALFGVVFGVSYLEAIGYSEEKSAFAISILWIGYAISCPILGYISDLLKRRNIIMISSSIIGIIAFLCLIFLKLSFFKIEILFFIVGFAGSGQNIAFAAIVEHVPNYLNSTAMGFNNAMISVFTTITPLLFGFFILFSKYKKAINLRKESFVYAIWILPVMLLISIMVVLFFIKETNAKKVI